MWIWRRILLGAGYLCYALALFVLFTYLNFPSQQVRAFVLATLSHYGLEQIHIGSVEPLLPVGLAFREVRMIRDVNGQPVEIMRLPELQVRLRTLHPFANQVRVAFEGGFYGGTLAGALEWESNGKAPNIGIRVDLQDFRASAHPLAAKLEKAMGDGRVAGSMTLQLAGGGWQDGNGDLTLRGDSGNIGGLDVGGIQLPSLSYEQFTGELTLQQRSVVVREFQIHGRDWQVDVHGNVSLNEPLPQSRLDLTIRVRTSDTLEQQLGIVGMLLKQRRDRRGFAALKISGTLEHPNPVL